MKFRNISDNDKIRSIIKILLEGSWFDGYYFGTSFMLFFFHEKRITIEEELAPKFLKLEILSDWWFGNKLDWEKKVILNGPKGHVEPAECVQAFELAKLRWINDSFIINVKFENNIMVIEFKNGKNISISMEEEIDIAWRISDGKIYFGESKLIIECEDKKIYMTKE